MSRAGQFNESRAHQRRAGRAGGFGGGGGGGGGGGEGGCKLSYTIPFPYREDQGSPIVRSPAFRWDDGPSSRVVPDDWFHYRGGGEVWDVRLDIPIRRQVFDAFDVDMRFQGAYADDTRLFTSDTHPGLDDFGPYITGFGEGVVSQMTGGRGGYVGWKRITLAYARDRGETPDYYGVTRQERWGVHGEAHPVVIPMSPGALEIGRHQWWQQPVWHDLGDPWQNHWDLSLTAKASGIFPGPGRGWMDSQNWGDDRNHQPTYLRGGTGVGVVNPDAVFASGEAWITDQLINVRGFNDALDHGRYMRDQRSGEVLTNSEFLTWGYSDGNEPWFFGLDYARGDNAFWFRATPILQFAHFKPFDEHPIWEAIRADGFEDFVSMTSGPNGALHGYQYGVLTYTKRGPLRGMRRLVVVQWVFDQYGVLGYGEREVVPVRYNYSSVGWHPDADLSLEMIEVAGK